jgi:hypothetical protein
LLLSRGKFQHILIANNQSVALCNPASTCNQCYAVSAASLGIVSAPANTNTSP